MNKYKVNLSKKGNQINSVDDWYNYAPPMKKDIHWKDGKSAKELAKYIIEANKYLPQELEVLLIKIGCRPSGELQGEPEAITGLKSRGQGRTHDLLLVKENEVVGFVLGLPKNMNNTSGPRVEAAKAYGELLKEKFNLPIDFIDERLTTVEAERMLVEQADASRKKRKKVIDKLAASLILQNYLDAKGKLLKELN